jgi:hypothetical protein
MTGTTYTLRVINESSSLWDMCVYQVDPDLGPSNAMSLAWFSKPSQPTTTLTFKWTIDYSFVWAETGQLIPGVYFDATQNWPADPSIVAPSTPDKAGNQVGFTKSGGAFTFTSTPVRDAKPGLLYIQQETTIPENQASVGIGMSGAGAFAVQAKPNIRLNLSPHPVYWLAAGSFAQGEVLDIGAINGPTDVRFPPNVYSMTAVLNALNQWTVKPTGQVNALEHKRVVAQEHRNQLAGAK